LAIEIYQLTLLQQAPEVSGYTMVPVGAIRHHRSLYAMSSVNEFCELNGIVLYIIYSILDMICQYIYMIWPHHRYDFIKVLLGLGQLVENQVRPKTVIYLV
jgi:hypothetical protein